MDLVKQKTINFTELIKNEENKLSEISKDNLLAKLTENFTDEQQKWYIANFYCYLHYHPTQDFCIDLQNIFSLLGFANKGNAKKSLENNFTVNEDYKILLLRTEKKDWGGSNKEQILLNVETFKGLCMMARTEEGKKIRKYYSKLESIFNETLKEQSESLQIKLNNQEKRIQEQQQLLEQNKPTEFLYFYLGQNPAIQDVTKIGISKTIRQRESAHKTSNPDFKFIYTYRTKNYKLIERYLKFLFEPFQHNGSPEWVDIPVNQVKKVTDFVVDFYDNFNGHSHYNNLVNFIENCKTHKTVYRISDEISFSHSVYQSFIEDCFEFGEKYKVTMTLIYPAFEKWLEDKPFKKNLKNKNDNYNSFFKKDIQDKLSDNLNILPERIDIINTFLDLNLANYLGFKGFKLKSMQNIILYNFNIYENFVKSCCEINESNKVYCKVLTKSFVEYLNTHFIPINSKMYTGRTRKLSSVFRNELVCSLQSINKIIHFKEKITIRSDKKNPSGLGGFIGIKLND